MLIESVCSDMSRDQRRIVEGVVNTFRPLIEATLTPDQIAQIFPQVEKSATEMGTNTTGIGNVANKVASGAKSVADVASKANALVDKAGRWLQDTKPVQAFDQKFETLKGTVASKLGNDSKIMSGIDYLGKYAKANPGKSAFVIGVLTSLAALGTGPLGGAIAGQVLRGANELLKGEKLSTAVGKGAKSAALGALAGAGAKELGSMLSGSIQATVDQLHPGVSQLKLNWRNLGGTIADINVHGLPQDIKPIQTAWRQAVAAYSSGNINGAAKYLTQVDQLVDKISTPQYIAKLAPEIADQQKWQAGANAFKKAIDGAVAAAQGAVTATTVKTPAPQPAPQPAPASNAAPANFNQVRESYRLTHAEIRQIFEASGWDKLKSISGKVASKVASTAKTVGHSLATKNTAAGLEAAWKKAGSPTDSDSIAYLLMQAGVEENVIKNAWYKLGIPYGAIPEVPPLSQRSGTTPASTTPTTEPAAEPTVAPTPASSTSASNKYKSPLEVVNAIMNTMPKDWLPEITAELLKRQRVGATKR